MAAGVGVCAIPTPESLDAPSEFLCITGISRHMHEIGFDLQVEVLQPGGQVLMGGQL
jgi:hypothetical protein